MVKAVEPMVFFAAASAAASSWSFNSEIMVYSNQRGAAAAAAGSGTTAGQSSLQNRIHGSGILDRSVPSHQQPPSLQQQQQPSIDSSSPLSAPLRMVAEQFSSKSTTHPTRDLRYTIETEGAYVAVDLELMVMREGQSDSYDDFGHDNNARLVAENTGAAANGRPKHKKIGRFTVHRGWSRS
ncbi:uncharacterized protein CCOS01_16452 [Colletotrichum costaricense]|uniref:Uncharacterized protein n=1 Tax=Colletotrichum costaricense TaxID=1209916 RepID=A0AAI9YFS3_9PEZI|nr:uncharacterized protein CCOS01_16452 [Colletotrichum costaricense]KAK1506593.1 hypothetical protein CCOS01_16452 [Colletotrichum costaricense]